MLQLYERCRPDTVTYVIECSYSFTLITNDMKRIYRRVFKSKKPSLGSIHGSGPATSTGTTDPVPSILACGSELDGTTSAQVAAGVSVSVQLRPLHLKVLTNCYGAERP